ncbi:hypothetical protein [Streptomyces jeddahensis]|uniref:Uncharacterized protein n=1 Tax=Streptomyces jeddahensis TaxID=1716141 RepID=A0A177HRJ8_9ACTN|nr:hypothetical protein [Streptomyces jeddahensis]OAH13067.1 hypothetical protein STSP_37140 [Streptomyces jeddahensis]
MNATDRRTEPWRDGDALTVCATTLIGLAVIAGAWFGVSGTVSATRQAAWLNAGAAGFAIEAGGLCLWLLRLRRAVGERRVALISLAPQEDAQEPMRTARPPRCTRPTDTTVPLPLVRAAGMTRVHHPDCPLVAGKDVTPAGLDDGEPCGVCAA